MGLYCVAHMHERHFTMHKQDSLKPTLTDYQTKLMNLQTVLFDKIIFHFVEKWE